METMARRGTQRSKRKEQLIESLSAPQQAAAYGILAVVQDMDIVMVLDVGDFGASKGKKGQSKQSFRVRHCVSCFPHGLCLLLCHETCPAMPFKEADIHY